MTDLELAIAHGVKLAILATLVGAVIRGHHRRCWTFTAYLGVIVSCNTLVTSWPGIFRTEEFWVLKQGAYDVLKLVIALELGFRTVRVFPGAAAAARRLAIVVLLASLAVILTGAGHESYRSLFAWQPQIIAATVWLFALTALLVAWYHLPLDQWHRAILMGFAFYLLVFVSAVNIIEHRGWSLGGAAGLLDSAAYLALSGWWAWAAWQPALAPAVTEEDVRRIAAGAVPRSV